MLYVFAIFLPPIAVFFTRGIWAALLTVILCTIFWLPGVIYALWATHDHYSRKRFAEFSRVLNRR